MKADTTPKTKLNEIVEPATQTETEVWTMTCKGLGDVGTIPTLVGSSSY